jgi:ABC-type polysaccharide/polyol phosphate transport system ATPase subunit
MNLHTAPEPAAVSTPMKTHPPDGIVVELDEATVSYRIPREHFRTFKEFAIRRVQGRVEFENLLALNKVTLQVRRGEVFGLIGANGAGKTTLLRLVARVMRPTSGRVVVRGRVAPLLAMGAGFHPELTGRENVFLNGALLGYTRYQIEECFDQIVDFAELRDFIEAPLRTYSSGMMARLGFSVATAVMPEVLIVDEVLSVGDIAFQEKCGVRISQFRDQGATILLVSHGMGSIKEMCDRAAWLSHGEVVHVGEADQVVEKFEKFMNVHPV